MTAKDYIINELEAFVKSFPKTRVRYEYDTLALVHVVEVLPNEVYHLDSNYIKWEDDIYENFATKFCDENICFVSDDSEYGIVVSEWAMEGLEYAPFSAKKNISNIFSTKVFPSTYKTPTSITFTDCRETSQVVGFNAINSYVDYPINDNLSIAA